MRSYSVRYIVLMGVVLGLLLTGCAEWRLDRAVVPAAGSEADNVLVTIFEDDFESGDLSSWDTVATHRFAVTSDLSRVHSGSYALEGTIDDGSPGSINKWFLPGYDEVYVRFNVMFEPGFQNMRGDGHGMHFASLKGNRIDDKWSSHGQAGITPDGTDFFVTTVDPDYTRGDPTLEPFTFYAYFPDMVPVGQRLLSGRACGTEHPRPVARDHHPRQRRDPGSARWQPGTVDRWGEEDRGRQHALARYQRASHQRVCHRRLHASATPDPAHLVRQHLGGHFLPR